MSWKPRMQDINPSNPFNGINVTRGTDGKTMFIPLPRSAWKRALPGAGPCTCGHCNGTAYWDTLATEGTVTWTVHYPELHS